MANIEKENHGKAIVKIIDATKGVYIGKLNNDKLARFLYEIKYENNKRALLYLRFRTSRNGIAAFSFSKENIKDFKMLHKPQRPLFIGLICHEGVCLISLDEFFDLVYSADGNTERISISVKRHKGHQYRVECLVGDAKIIPASNFPDRIFN